MMKPYTWSPGQTLEEQKNGAYFERNMMVLLMAVSMSQFPIPGTDQPAAGWYRHPNDSGIIVVDAFGFPGGTDYKYWEDKSFSYYGWSRVIALYGGAVTFHVPDDFDIGALPQIQPCYDGHSTEEKWYRVMHMCGCAMPIDLN
jgi:hypothetical protein